MGDSYEEQLKIHYLSLKSFLPVINKGRQIQIFEYPAFLISPFKSNIAVTEVFLLKI